MTFTIRYTFLKDLSKGITGTFGHYTTRVEAEKVARWHNDGFGKRVKHEVVEVYK